MALISVGYSASARRLAQKGYTVQDAMIRTFQNRLFTNVVFLIISMCIHSHALGQSQISGAKQCKNKKSNISPEEVPRPASLPLKHKSKIFVHFADRGISIRDELYARIVCVQPNIGSYSTLSTHVRISFENMNNVNYFGIDLPEPFHPKNHLYLLPLKDGDFYYKVGEIWYRISKVEKSNYKNMIFRVEVYFPPEGKYNGWINDFYAKGEFSSGKFTSVLWNKTKDTWKVIETNGGKLNAESNCVTSPQRNAFCPTGPPKVRKEHCELSYFWVEDLGPHCTRVEIALDERGSK